MREPHGTRGNPNRRFDRLLAALDAADARPNAAFIVPPNSGCESICHTRPFLDGAVDRAAVALAAALRLDPSK